ncbi:MAG: hypothetical protein H6581_28270 [Bacteroidia bacterium]|nr:hypothetical protein [Bacteroidia bacterium]
MNDRLNQVKEKEQNDPSQNGSTQAPGAFQLKSADPVANSSPNNGGGNSVAALQTAPPPFQLKAEGEENQQGGNSLLPVQRKENGDEGGTTSVTDDAKGMVIDVAKSKAVDFAWAYWDQLKEQFNLKNYLAELLEKACLYLVDYGLKVTGISSYLMAITPYLEILKAVKTIIETIPRPIRVFIGYAMGYGLKKFSDKNMWGAIEEKHLNFLLIEGGDAAATVGNIIDFLYDLGHNPLRTIYKGIWAAVRYFTGNDEIDSMTDYLTHLENGAKDATGYSGPRDKMGQQGQGNDQQKEESGADKARKDNLFNADLGFFWVRMGMPKLDRWNDETGKERGGMVIDGGLGVKVFDNAMGSDDIELQLPYSADWTMTFRDTMILSEQISLGNWFSTGPVSMPLLRLKSGVGVDYMSLKMLDFAFGQDVFIAKELGMTYSASDKKLGFYGDTIMNFFGHTLLGKFHLDVGTDGQLQGGYVDVILPEELDLIKDRLTLGNLNFIGRWGKEGLELLELAGDIHLNFNDKLDFDSTRTAIRWQNGEFIGSIQQLSVLVPLGATSFVELIMDSGSISKEGFKADKITLKFSYGDEETQEQNEQRLHNKKDETPQIDQKDIQSIIPGFNLDWIQHTGIDTLVVSASANGVSIGADGFHMDGDLEKKLHKFAAHLLGVKAKFNGDTNEGSLEGKWDYAVPNLPQVSFDFPILPGINAGLGIGAKLEMGAELDGKLQKMPHRQDGPIQPWDLGGYAGLHGSANVQAHFDVSAGHPLLVSIHAGMFAEAGADMAADAALHGTINWDEDAHRISLSNDPKERPSASFDMHADLNAALGAHIKARAFHIFEVTLWEYRFLNWNMGIWRAKGRLNAKEDGGYEFKFEQTAFDGGKPGRKPEIEFKVAKTEDVILERERKSDEISDSLLFWRLVHDVMDPTQPMDQATRRIMLEKLRRLNDTGQPLEYFTGETNSSMENRLGGDETGVSLLMTKPEWEEYSRVKGFWGMKSRSKDDKKIDRYLDQYHATRDLGRRKELLIDLIDNVMPAYLHEGHDRDAMVAKLLSDAKRELKRLEGMQNSEPQDAMGNAGGWGSGF